MLGALVFGIAAAWLSVVVGKPVVLAIGGAVAGVVWASPHLSLGAGGEGYSGLAFALFLGVMAACAVGLVQLIRMIRPRREIPLEVVEYDAAETFNSEAYPLGMERHFHTPGPREASLPGMWRGGFYLLGCQIASDLAWTASRIDRLASRWRGRGRGPAETSQGVGSGRGGIGERRYDDRAAA